MAPAALAERLRAIRLSQSDLARRIGLPFNTVSRILLGSVDARASNVEAIKVALVAEEKRLRDYLVGLHGCPQDEGEKAV